MRKSTHDYLADVINGMSKTILIDALSESGNLHTIYSCSTLWLTIGNQEITIGGNTYKVVSVSPFYTGGGTTKPFVIVEGADPIVIDSFDIPLPYFYHGTILRVNEELNEVPLSWNKLPFIYLRGEIEEKFIEDGSIGDANELESPCRIYLMAESNIEDWSGNQHEELAVAPMRNLSQSFLEALRNSPLVGKFEDYTITNKVKWGRYEDDKGSVKQIFKDFMSGVEIVITIPFARTSECCTN